MKKTKKRFYKKNNRRLSHGVFFLLFISVLCLDVQLFTKVEQEADFAYTIERDRFYEIFRDEQVPLEVSQAIADDGGSFSERIFTYFVTGKADQDTTDKLISKLNRKNNSVEQEFLPYIDAVWNDIQYFPVPVSSTNEEATVQYTDSWMQSRTYGGERGHEGCDVMADIDERGVYPVISMTDGVIEQIGWLTLGGYRIGVRSPNGGYFYYAHLYDYAKDFQIGEEVSAGELLGFMGDSGYGETPGTIGNFPVHLHVGIYFNDKDGNEVSVNPYWVLRFLDDKKLVYDY